MVVRGGDLWRGGRGEQESRSGAGWAEAGGGGGSAIRVGVKVWGEGAVTGVWAIPMVLLDETSK